MDSIILPICLILVTLTLPWILMLLDIPRATLERYEKEERQRQERADAWAVFVAELRKPFERILDWLSRRLQ